MTQNILSYLLSPVSIKSFLEEHYENKHLLIQDRSPDYYNDILNLKDIDAFFQHGHIRPRDILVTRNHKANLSNWAHLQDNGTLVISKENILKCLYKGDSLVIHTVEEYLPKINRIAERLSREMKCRVKAYVFITPPQSQGFVHHVDDLDIFILQIYGSKKWRLYDDTIELPDQTITYNDPKSQPKVAFKELNLCQGELLYLPRGVGHDANTVDDLSIHASFGLCPVRWLDVLRVGIDKSFPDGNLRRSYPFWNNSSTVLKKRIEEVKDVLHRRIDQISDEEVMEIADDLICHCINKSYESRFRDFVGSHTVSGESRVICRGRLIIGKDMNDHLIIIRNDKGKQFMYPIFAKDAIASISISDSIKVKNLDGNQDLNNKIKLVKKLMEDGLIRRSE